MMWDTLYIFDERGGGGGLKIILQEVTSFGVQYFIFFFNLHTSENIFCLDILGGEGEEGQGEPGDGDREKTT